MNIFVKPFLQILKQKQENITNDCLLQLYDDLRLADSDLRLADSDLRLGDSDLRLAYSDLRLADLDTAIVRMHRVLQPPTYSDFVTSPSQYFPIAIQEYILSQKKWIWRATLGNFNIHLTLFRSPTKLEMTQLREQVRRAFVWLRICAKYASPRCAETLDVYLFLTPFAKTLPLTPGATLSVEHVNTAFTRPCHGHGEIVVYRAEEWFKVFLHETFHAFGFDFGTDGLTKAAKERLQHIFPIASKLDINESYTEVWARIVNCAMQSFYALPKLNQNEKAKETFMNYLEFSLNLERMFAIYQSQKMLEHMGLTFENFCKHPYAARYKENSHIFAYYIVTAVLLNNLPTFLQWCQTQNAPTCCFQFAQTAETQNALVTFIAKQVQQTLPRLNVACNRSLRQTTRMTVLG